MREIATFGAGCFWGIEKIFSEAQGVIATEVGYAGGTTISPSYEQVCSHMTEHAEVVKVTFDPDIISYNQLLTLFWQAHNPTTLNRQGPDIGSQYRSVIFYHTEEQKKLAQESKLRYENENNLQGKVVTAILPAADFYRAEEYHQHYFDKHHR
jgi:peptide-methionine (S)-S-oxide reductase